MCPTRSGRPGGPASAAPSRRTTRPRPRRREVPSSSSPAGASFASTSSSPPRAVTTTRFAHPAGRRLPRRLLRERRAWRPGAVGVVVETLALALGGAGAGAGAGSAAHAAVRRARSGRRRQEHPAQPRAVSAGRSHDLSVGARRRAHVRVGRRGPRARREETATEHQGQRRGVVPAGEVGLRDDGATGAADSMGAAVGDVVGLVVAATASKASIVVSPSSVSSRYMPTSGHRRHCRRTGRSHREERVGAGLWGVTSHPPRRAEHHRPLGRARPRGRTRNTS